MYLSNMKKESNSNLNDFWKSKVLAARQGEFPLISVRLDSIVPIMEINKYFS